MMTKFYNREHEIALLEQIEQQAQEMAQMTFVVGRRRVGKTALLNHAFKGEKIIYFFVEKKNESLLCEEFVDEIKRTLDANIYGRYQNFKEIFSLLMDISQQRHFTLIIDEFQEFININPAVFSEMQNIWDSKKNKSKINLVLCGSIYSLMKKIFENYKEPLFGRATAHLHVKPFDTCTLKEILKDHYPNYTNDDLLGVYIFTGGVAKYVELLINKKAFTKKRILDEIFSANSLFLNEGRNVLVDEFGKDYGNYFSIISLIASSKTSRSEIESVMNISVGGFLDKLEKEYGLITKIRPFLAKPTGRDVKYRIEDNFLHFWFRFIFKYRSAIEIANFDYVRNIVERDYETYSGLVLEKYFRTKMIESKQFSDIGSYWDKKGENEIDVIALNDMEKRLMVCEVKRNKKRINLSALKEKAKSVVEKYSDYRIEYKGLSLDDM